MDDPCHGCRIAQGRGLRFRVANCARKIRAARHLMGRCTLRLFVAGESPRADRAIVNLRHLCEQVMTRGCRFEVVDIRLQPAKARRYGIMATPTLVRTAPRPARRVIGDLSDTDRVLAGLGLQGRPADGPSDI